MVMVQIWTDQCGSSRHGPANVKLVHTCFYNAITLNKREIDRVHKNELYIATVSIKQKAGLTQRE